MIEDLTIQVDITGEKNSLVLELIEGFIEDVIIPLIGRQLVRRVDY